MLNESQLKEIGIKNWAVLSKNFDNADLLLGNGFSQNITGHFYYDSLFNEFLNSRNDREKRIFRSFRTNNFERIQEILIDAKRVNRLFGIAPNDSRIGDAIDSLRTGLIHSVRNNHPKFSDLDRNQLQRLAKQLIKFHNVFTLNYDLFLYHILMQMKDEAERNQVPFPCSDYFWGEYDERFKQFMGFDVQHEMHFHYLHGALFLFKYPPDTCKLKRADDFKELKDMIGDVINEGTMPLFVSEGSSKEKLKTIERSDYLSFCLRRLKESKSKLVVFGISFSKNDAHIVNAISRSKPKREIAISIHIGKKSKSDLTTEIERLTTKFKSHKISFYDSSTIFSF